MAKLIVSLLFASVAAADYNLTYLDVLWRPAPTLTLVESNNVATTYELQCPNTTTTTPTPTTSASLEAEDYPDTPSESAAWYSSIYSYLATAFPAVTPKSIEGRCIPFTLFQGPETYGMRLTHSQPGLYTLNGDCSWTGEFTKVPITCDAELKGSIFGTEFSSGTPTVLPQSELSAGSEVGFAVATVVERTGATSATSGNVESPARETGAASTGSAGMAGRASLPTGVVVMAGGAFAVGAAAWML